jgi:hypothetical protein
MLFVIGYILFSIILISIFFHLIEHAPSGWEDENGFHTDLIRQQKQQAYSQSVSLSNSFKNVYHSPAADAYSLKISPHS